MAFSRRRSHNSSLGAFTLCQSSAVAQMHVVGVGLNYCSQIEGTLQKDSEPYDNVGTLIKAHSPCEDLPSRAALQEHCTGELGTEDARQSRTKLLNTATCRA